MNTNNPVIKLLLEHGITQSELGSRLKVSRGYVNQVVHGRKRSNAIRYRIARFFNVEITDLWPNCKKNQAGRKP